MWFYGTFSHKNVYEFNQCDNLYIGCYFMLNACWLSLFEWNISSHLFSEPIETYRLLLYSHIEHAEHSISLVL